MLNNYSEIRLSRNWNSIPIKQQTLRKYWLMKFYFNIYIFFLFHSLHFYAHQQTTKINLGFVICWSSHIEIKFQFLTTFIIIIFDLSNIYYIIYFNQNMPNIRNTSEKSSALYRYIIRFSWYVEKKSILRAGWIAFTQLIVPCTYPIFYCSTFQMFIRFDRDV